MPRSDGNPRGKAEDSQLHEVCSYDNLSLETPISIMNRGRVVDLATNCYGCHVLQKALDCEEDIRLLIVSELLLGDPALTLVNKHASHVWSKVRVLC
jgi:hypothetical protein